MGAGSRQGSTGESAPRLGERRYRQHLVVAMVCYVSALLLALPASRHAGELPLKVLLALVPVLPMFYVIALMAWRVRDSDEFEQRTHLVALAASAALTGGLSLVGGFLAAAGVPGIDGSLLMWVFPSLVFGYGVARWWVLTRHYGGSLECEGGFRLPQRLMLVAGLLLIVLLVGWWRGRLSPFDVGLIVGLVGAAVITAIARLLIARRLRRSMREPR